MSHDCVFCAIVAGDAPAFAVHDGPATTAFLSTGGAHPEHTLVVPDEHVADVRDLRDDQCRAVTTTVRDVADAMWDAADPDGVNCYQANGHDQDIDHVHVHVIPKFAGDGKRHVTVTEDGYRAGWDTETFSDAQREDASERLRRALGNDEP